MTIAQKTGLEFDYMDIKHKLWKILEIFCEIVFFIFPIKKKRVMFRSFAGQYNDNPRRISEKLYDLDSTIEFIWVISDKCHEIDNIPKYIKQVSDNTILSRYYKKTSKVLVENGIGWDMWLKYNYLYPIYKRKSQFNVSTWHGGVTLKHLGYDIKEYSGYNRNNGATTSDIVTLSNEISRNMFINAFFGNNLKFIESGTPKNDILFNLNLEKRNGLLQKMKLDSKFKYVLYAPTYRDDSEFSGVRQMKEFDIKKLLSVLNKKFDGEFRFIIRPHNLVLNILRNLNIVDNIYVFDGNVCDDMNEYLYVSDVLITDYSSCIGDNLLTNKPCFLYVPDLNQYNSTRGQGGDYYMDIFDFPEPKSMNFNELINSIENYDSDSVITKRQELLVRIGNYEIGNAAETIANLILDKIYN